MSTISDRRDALDSKIGVSSSFKKRRKKLTNIEEEEKQKTFQESINDQINNYKTRLDASGIEEPDSRNALEKLLNLPEDQNFIFDIGELLDRPANALRGAIEAAQEGEDIGEAAKKGITGEEDYYFGDILRNAGVSDEKLFTNPLNGKDVSAADLLGTAADIFIDPLNIPVAGGITKALNVSKATKELTTAQDALQTLNKANKSIGVEEVSAKALKNAEIEKATDRVTQARQNLESIKSAKAPNTTILEGLVQGVAAGAKGTAKVADRVITKGLDASKQRQINKLVKKGASDELIANKNFLADTYSGAKKGISSTLNYSKSLPNNVMSDVREGEAAIEGSALVATKRAEDARKKAEDFAINSNDFKDVNEVDRAINMLAESNKSKDTSMETIFSRMASDSKYSAEGTTESVTKAVNQLNNIKRVANSGIKFKVEDAGNGLSKIKLEKGRTNISTLKTLAQNDKVREQLRNINITRASKLTDEKTAQLSKYQKLLENNEDFRNLYNEATSIMNDYAKDVYNKTGKNVDYTKITDIPGYARKELADDALKARGIDIGAEYASAGVRGNKKAMGTGKKGKYTDYSTDEANVLRQEQVEYAKETRQAKLKSLNNSLPENRQKKLKQELAKVRKNIKEQEAKFNENLKKAQLSADKVTQLKKIKDSQLDNFSDVVSEDIKNKIKNIANPDNANGYVKAANAYTTTHNKLVSEMNKLTKDGLTARETKTITNNIEKLNADLIKKQNRVDLQKAKLEGAITQKAEKEASKAAKNIEKTSKMTKDSIALSEKEQKATSKIQNLEQANASIISKLKTKENNLIMKIENLDPTLEKNMKIKDDILKEEKKISEEISLLESQAGKDLFTNSYFGGLENFIKESSEQAKSIQAYTKTILESGLNDDKIIKFIDKGSQKEKVPFGYTELKGTELSKITNYLDSYKNLMPESSKAFLDYFKEKIGKSQSVIMDNSAYDLIKLGVNGKNANLFVDVINGATNTFKKYSTFSLGFQMRNFTGNMTNIALSGIPIKNIAYEATKTNKLLNNKNMWELLIKDVDNTKTLTKSERENVALLKDFINAGFLGQGTKVRDLQEVLNKVEDTKQYRNRLKKLVDGVFELNIKANEWLDAHSRMTVLSYARKHPEYVSKLGAKNPIDAVKKVIFDPSNMSPWEKNVAKKIIPFYTFTKQNLLFQASNIIKNTSKYSNLLKAFNETYGSLDEDQYRDYQKESMQVPIFTDEEGNTVTLKTNLPAADLGEWVENPLQKLVVSTSPFIRTPYEMVTGVDTFTGAESNKTGLDYLTGMFGLSSAEKLPERLSDLSSDNTGAKNFTDLFGSVASYNDAEKIANSNAYEEYLKYQEYIKSLKDQGVNVPTLTELEQQGIDIDSIRDKIAGNDSALRNLKKRREELQKSLGY